ncbi:hypothetical protein [Polymorphospora sp. NPDC050346]|uniref:hypothetical protein n=1 Tax=Polymorphospora sp. NPDC050346 TaxID=3155780 RepID=UPI0033DC63AD
MPSIGTASPADAAGISRTTSGPRDGDPVVTTPPTPAALPATTVLAGEVIAPPSSAGSRLDVGRWLASHRPRDGADLTLLRGLADDVAGYAQATAAATGQPAEVVDQLAGHSLRAGFATAREAAGAPQEVAGRVLGHRPTTTGLYVRHGFDGRAQLAVYELAIATGLGEETAA